MARISQAMEKILNEQINAEIYSSYLYLSMATYFENHNLTGFANWMKVQAQEELAHAMKFYHYIYEREGTVTLKSIAAPDSTWPSVAATFEGALNHEKHVTHLINNIVNLAFEEKDHASYNFMQWFVAEQVEEESSANEIWQKVKLIGKEGPALYMLDKELGRRTFAPPTAANN